MRTSCGADDEGVDLTGLDTTGGETVTADGAAAGAGGDEVTASACART